MAITTYTNSPYNDDFATADDNYLRILFQPGRSVQVRELNQLQSNLQNQIDKFGSHVFKDGDRVLNGYTTYDENIQSVPITFVDGIAPTIEQLNALKGLEVYNSTKTDLNAKIMGVEKFVGNNNSSFYRLYLKYFGTNINGSTITDKFAASDVLMLGTTTSITLGTNKTVSENLAIGEVASAGASLENPGYFGGFFQDEGVFFIKGCFVHTDAQSQFYIKSSAQSQLSGDCVFNVVEEIVTHEIDSTLLDNAAGTPNQNAPGADRYKVTLSLAFVPSGSTSVTANQQRIELLEIVEDNVTLPARTEYSELAKALATRTDETNGSFTAKSFEIDIREYYNDEAGNRGKYTKANIRDENNGGYIAAGSGSDAAAEGEGKKRYVIGIEPSTAYVNGYRVELEDRQDLVALKGQEAGDIKSETNYQLSANSGGYILATYDGIVLPATFFSQANDYRTVPDQTFILYDNVTQSSRGSGIGTCRISAITRNPDKPRATVNNDASASEALYRIYIYDINITVADKTLKDVKHIGLTGTGITSNGFTNSDGFSLEGIGNKVFELPYDAVASTGSITYNVVTQHKVPIFNSANNQHTIAAAAGKFTSTNPLDYVVIMQYATSGATATSYGHIVPTLVEITNAGVNAVLTIEENDGVNDAIINTGTADMPMLIYAPEEVTRAAGKKATTTVTDESITTALNPGTIVTLDNTDGFTLDSVTIGGVEIKDDFIFDGGQTPTHYGYATLKYIGTITYPSQEILVDYKHFEEVSSGPFTAESYTTPGNDGNSVAYPSTSLSQIPLYEDTRLSNSIDFRQSITSSSFGYDIVPGTTASFDISYYTSRIDLIVLNQLGDASIIQGVAGTDPKRPQLPKDSIELYEINKPGYLYSLDDLDITENNQRGYKMQDIGELEARIKNIEYYTALTMLEKETSEKQLFDGSGERFKNGIFTDAFTGHGGGDTSDTAYKIGIDREEGVARPMYLSENSRWSYKDTPSSLQSGATSTTTSWNNETVSASTVIHSGKRKGVVCLDFIEKTQVVQPFATEHMSVNPYDVATWSGSIEISPTSDEWKDVTHRPDIVNNVEGNNDALLKQISDNPNILGTEWNEWQTSWTGWRWGRRRWFRGRRRGRRGGGSGTWRRRRSSRGRWRRNWWWRRRQARSGIQTSLKTTFKNEVVDDVPVDTSFIPFIRSRKVYFKGDLLKPNTKFYIYFDDVDVTSYAAKATFVQFGGAAGEDGGTDVVRYDGQTSGFGATGDITTNASGEVAGWVVIPNNDLLRFRTGTRQIRLTDSETNNKLLETSSAETSYFARGILETRQRTVLSTRQLSLERTRVSQARNVRRRRWRVWRDPVAQTFMIGNEPTGIFLSSVDLFIQDADPSIPIELSIVTVENGIPTQDTVPHSKVTKKIADVNIAGFAQTSSNFMFDQPVYLQPGVEYAVVLISNSARWRVWVSRVGGTNVVSPGQNAEKVTKNVNLGVLLKSQNASTWTPDQNADLKFTLNRADFQEENDQTAVFTGICPQRKEVTYVDVAASNNKGYNAGPPAITFTSTSGSGAAAYASISKGGKIDRIIVTNGGTGYTDIPAVTIASPSPIVLPTARVDTTNNVLNLSNFVEFEDGQMVTYTSTSAITGMSTGTAYYLKQVTSTSFPNGGIYQVYSDDTLQSQVSLTGTGADTQTLTPEGGATGTAILDTWRGSMFYNLIEEMVLPEAETEYSMKLRGEDTSAAGTAETAEYEIVPNDIVYTGERFTHDVNSGQNASTYDNELALTATLKTTDSKISPIIDLDRLSLLSFDNIIGRSSEIETNQNAGQGLARYLSKIVDLENPADGINIYFDAVLPDSSCDIKVYLKRRLLNSDSSSSTPMSQKSFIELTPEGDKKPRVNTSYEFDETEFSYQDDDAQFDQFQIKIVFTSSNPAFAPEIKNLRAIATV